MLMDPPGVVQDGEQPDDIADGPRLPGQAKPVLVHPGPVGNAVVAAPGEGLIFEDGVEDQRDVERHDSLVRRIELGNLPVTAHHESFAPEGSNLCAQDGVCVLGRSSGEGRLLPSTTSVESVTTGLRN